MEKSNQNRPRFGLTWRVIAMSSLLLIGLTTAFTFFGRNNLLRQFDEVRDSQLERQKREIRQSMDQSSDNLRQIASLIAASSQLGNALKEEKKELISSVLDHNWPTLQLEAGIDELQVFSRSGLSLAHWGNIQTGNALPISQWVTQVISSETPLTTLRCFADCRQYALAPMLVDGQSLGVTLVSRSLAEVTRQAREVSGSDVALLITGKNALENLDVTRSVSAWHGGLATLTNQQEMLPLLHQAAYKSSLESLNDSPIILRNNERKIELSSIVLQNESEQYENGHFLLMSDITPQIDAINRDTGTIFATGLLGWLAAEALLLTILWRPMARVRRLSSVLPALAQGGFAKARNLIPEPKRCLSDEIDILDATALDLARQLEALESEVQSRDELLHARLEELGRERDFIENLLDTAQVLILTQDDQGRISLVNQYCQDTLGQPYEIIVGQRFEALFLEQNRATHGSISHQGEERLLKVSNDDYRTVVWYHARLSGSNERAMHTISVGIDITERKAAESRLTWLANRDPLTGLYNRRAFQERLELALESEKQGAILFIDLDQFKDVNELSGHLVGDQLLELVANNLHKKLDGKGIIARLGGDEFAVLAENIDELNAIQIAKDFELSLDNTSILLPGGRLHRASGSIGIACYPLHGHTSAELMANVDVAMYKAKGNSLKSWHILSTQDEEKSELQQRVYWVERIRGALKNDDFELMAQPIVGLEDRSTKHYEILIRLRDRNNQLIPPGRFIPTAERSGQIIQIDRWVLKKSLRLLRKVQANGISLSINLSGNSLHDEGLYQYLVDELHASGANPNQLIIEITETAAVTDFSTARSVLKRIRNLGCQTALDDFGVGFSSFHYLAMLPIDYIKIDGSFIQHITSNSDNRVIVKAISDIASGFGKKAIAEFVDHEITISLLREYGIAYGQGYHLGKPEKASKIVEKTQSNH
ncbi:MAG: GGDEF domain-containing protein [Halomonadaceae bacterium]|nr:GGDEF domain-containing protein [Halomonadaceae bacterium]